MKIQRLSATPQFVMQPNCLEADLTGFGSSTIIFAAWTYVFPKLKGLNGNGHGGVQNGP
jgi:hypothetical protein